MENVLTGGKVHCVLLLVNVVLILAYSINVYFVIAKCGKFRLTLHFETNFQKHVSNMQSIYLEE